MPLIRSGHHGGDPDDRVLQQLLQNAGSTIAREMIAMLAPSEAHAASCQAFTCHHARGYRLPTGREGVSCNSPNRPS